MLCRQNGLSNVRIIAITRPSTGFVALQERSKDKINYVHGTCILSLERNVKLLSHEGLEGFRRGSNMYLSPPEPQVFLRLSGLAIDALSVNTY